MSTAAITHIDVDDEGVARIAGTRTKVVLLIEDFRYRGWSPEAIHQNYPNLSLAQIHAAFAYYYDHQSELDAEIERRRHSAKATRAKAEETPGRKKLRDMGLRP
jgi:uncharacterized protein (DUF433 family)